jgi:hypothetical protein
MADRGEVLRYELDISDVEAKAKRVQELTEQIARGRTGGKDTAELEHALSAELDGMGRLARQTGQSASETTKLVRQKQRLAQVVSLLGGRFGGLVRQLGSMVEMLVAGGRAAVGFGAALAGLTVAVGAINSIQAALRQLREEQEQLNQSIADFRQKQAEALSSMSTALSTLGLESPTGEQAAGRVAYGLQRHFGYQPDVAMQVAPLAVAGGLSVEDAAALYQLQQMGYAPRTGADVEKLFQTAPPETLAEARRRAGDVVQTVGGYGASMEARPPVRLRPDELAVQALKDQGVDITIDEYRSRVARGREVQARMRQLDELLAQTAGKPPEFGSPESFGHEDPREWERRNLSRELKNLIYYTNTADRYEAGYPSPPPPGTAPHRDTEEVLRGRATHVHTYNVGTLFNVGDRRTSPWNNARLGLSESGDRD